MTTFTPVSALSGGALIGLAASLLMMSHGRIAGISGIYKGLLPGVEGDRDWRVAFVGGLLLAGLAFTWLVPGAVEASAQRSVGLTAVAGLIVGVGVTMGNGCTSGHGVCGISRISRRSLVATAAFMTTGMITATLVQLLMGGVL